MLSSVFKRKKVQEKIANITGARRAQSPPGQNPHDIQNVAGIYEKLDDLLVRADNAAKRTLNGRTPSTPQVQLDLGRRESYSEWFPADLLSGDTRLPPQRNASLPNVNGSAASLTRTSTDHGGSSAEPPFPASVDDIIIIESSSQESRELYRLSAACSDSELQSLVENNSHSSLESKKPTPAPIKIPDNTAFSKRPIQHSASAGPSADPADQLQLPGSSVPTRPSTPGSACTDIPSSVSGTTLARALVASSFILTSDSRGSRYRSGITRQDSATLPRGEHPFHGRKRKSNASDYSQDLETRSPIPPVPPLPSSAELSARGMDSASNVSKSRRNSLTAVADYKRSSAELPYLSNERRNSISGPSREQTGVHSRISTITEASSPVPSTKAASVKGDGTSVRSAESIIRPVSSIQESGHASPAITESSDQDVEAPQTNTEPTLIPEDTCDSDGREAHREEFDGDELHRKRAISPVSVHGTTTSAYSLASYEGASMRTSESIFRSPGAVSQGGLMLPYAGGLISRSRSESSAHNRNGSGSNRPITLLPIGGRPRSVLMQRPSSSPRISSDSDFRALPLVTSVPPAAHPSDGSTPIESPDLLDFMFPVAPAALVRARSGRVRDGSQLPPLAIVDDDHGLPTPTLSSDMESMAPVSTNIQTFPETPYAFSPLLSAGVPAPMPPPPPRLGPNQSPVSRTLTTHRAGVAELKQRWGQQRTPLLRSITAPSGIRAPPTPPSSVESTHDSPPANGEHAAASLGHSAIVAHARLSRIEESQTPPITPAQSSLPEGMALGLSTRLSPTVVSPDQAVHIPESYIANSAEATLSAGTNITSPNPRPLPVSPAPANALLQTDKPPDDSPPPSYASMQEASSVVPPLEPRIVLDAPRPAGSPSRQSSLQSSSASVSSSSSVSKSEHTTTLISLPSPPPSGIPLPPSPIPSSPMPSIDEQVAVTDQEQPPPPPYVEVQRPSQPAPPSSPARSISIISQHRTGTPDSVPLRRVVRTRPPPPLGPRKPSGSGRSRATSVSSSVSNYGGPSTTRRPSMATLSASGPKFQTTQVNFRGLTKEQAEWTFTSEELQQLVSAAIRQTTDVSAIRLLPLETLNEALPEEIKRLEMVSAELRTNYKINVRRRKMLMSSLFAMTDGIETCDGVAAARTLEELTDVTETLDHQAEELFDVTTQLGQLTHLRDVHSSSALIMALHKLNRSLKKHLEQGQKLREQVAIMEAERDEAWKQAQEVAQDFDDLQERTCDPASTSMQIGASSRRSSRVILARKNSARVAKTGLRSSLHRRSQRSSVSSSHLASVVTSPAMRSAGISDVPPVPPIPIQTTWNINTDLPTSQTGAWSESPSSGFRAMTEAQRELCEMLGISLDDLNGNRPSRRQSTSATIGVKSPISPSRLRRNSESHMMTPLPSASLLQAR